MQSRMPARRFAHRGVVTMIALIALSAFANPPTSVPAPSQTISTGFKGAEPHTATHDNRSTAAPDPTSPAGATQCAAKGELSANDVTCAVIVIAGDLRPYIGALAAAGVLAMAIVEFLKAVLSLQLVFQRISLLKWLGISLKYAFEWRKTRGDVLVELLYLSIGDRKHLNVLCGQELSKMVVQIQAAARIALDYPDMFPSLFKFLTASDLAPQLGAPPPAPLAGLVGGPAADPARLLVHAQVMHAAVDVPGPVIGSDEALQNRTRLANLVARKLEGFQLRIAFWWARFNQLLSMVVSVVICIVALKAADPSLSIWACLLLGIGGGMLAPFSKDFSQALTRIATGNAKRGAKSTVFV